MRATYVGTEACGTETCHLWEDIKETRVQRTWLLQNGWIHRIEIIEDGVTFSNVTYDYKDVVTIDRPD